ncbi:hypothetical protein CXG81DRAFT_3710, partial [Caulochytrium protostelioides]
KYLAALDQGTTSTRFIIFSLPELQVVASHQCPFSQRTPQSGWVEHDAHEILDTVITCMNAAARAFLALAPPRAGTPMRLDQIQAMGITNQRETVVAWDAETGRALHAALVWMDARTQETIHAMVRDGRLPADPAPYFSAFKMRWLLDHVPAVRDAQDRGTLRFGTMDTWLLWHLTQGRVYATDLTNASRTFLMDIQTSAWDPALMGLFGVRPENLPTIRSSSELFGCVDPSFLAAAKPMAGSYTVPSVRGHVAVLVPRDATTLGGMPITAMLGDQQAALIGHGGIVKGALKNTYGTGCFLLCHTGSDPVFSPPAYRLLTTVAYRLGPHGPTRYALEGSVAVAGAGVRWLCEGMGLAQNSSEVNALAQTVYEACFPAQMNAAPPLGPLPLFIPALTGLLAPHWHAGARGTFMGLSSATTRHHMAYAVLESVAWSTRDLLIAMMGAIEAATHEAMPPVAQLHVDGGLSTATVAMQLQADALGCDVLRPTMHEVTALGAALAA